MKKLTQREMINKTMKAFNFNYVHDAMTKLEWAWYLRPNGYEIPSIDDLKRRARDIIDRSITTVLSDDLNCLIPATVSSGGFRATAWKTKKGKLNTIELTFIVTGFRSHRKQD